VWFCLKRSIVGAVFENFKGTTSEDSLNLPLYAEIEVSASRLEYSFRVAGNWLLDKQLWLEQMMNAREDNREMYFSRFPPSIETLCEYLKVGPIENPNQILFLVIDKSGDLIGHAGLKVHNLDQVEIDNVLRISDESPGIMEIALTELLSWSQKTLTINTFKLQVIGTNTRAIALYSKFGFITVEKKSLRIEHLDNGLTRLLQCPENQANTEEEMLIMEKHA